MIKIMVVEDDRNVAELISLYLRKEGFETKEVYNGREAVELFPAYAPFLVLLDLMLPGMDGYKVCEEIRKTSLVPIIMLTAKGETFDKVRGLELGADDYIVKPFEPSELVARVKAVLRRYEQKDKSTGQVIDLPNLHIDPVKHIVIYHGSELELPPKEFELLHYLALHPGRPFSRDDLLTVCWGYDFPGDTRTVDVHVMRIREKLNKDDPWSLKTVWGVGYKIEVPQ
ncbi:MAG: response regulator transcription factor [Defluviitaleaceae bacterium]|nr:response regulator transcription factor [Defluviitaleaceae bacterium]